jgi:hypothetical protein
MADIKWQMADGKWAEAMGWFGREEQTRPDYNMYEESGTLS